MEAFERMKDKVESLESQAEISGELAANSAGTSVDLEKRFQSLEGSSKIEDEMNLLRKQLPRYTSGSKLAELPSSIDIVRDVEYENMKKEFGKR